ncbi:hypothetical protein [Asticcacaulis sp. YBE204]|uniref:hypothetical protein n=1 Tax=Asticcacaulis sp. YBE204 TaxID=1282363 RepID=UPI0003C3BD7F|nr:hypothetical protein [Asticcacaulis sp. YBE204]ESQ77484.1 hypothetical protein AEYBE204_17240 [Asticcacaulis sp. YBE204]
MRILGAIAAAAVCLMFSAPAEAAYNCAKPTAGQAHTDEDKVAIFAIQKKIQDAKAVNGKDYLGPQDGIMCDAPDGKGKFWHFANASIYW